MSEVFRNPAEESRYLNDPGFHACVESLRAGLRFGLTPYDLVRCGDIAIALEARRIDELQNALLADETR